MPLDDLKCKIAKCKICAGPAKATPLPHEPRPVLVVSSTAKIAIVGQAPGARVHKSGIPFDDPSGDRLRQWMGLNKTQFYDANRLAIIPMGFCFPGRDEKGADLPPRPECATAWRHELMSSLPQLDLMLVIGIYAQKWHLGKLRKKNLTLTTMAWREYRSGSCLMVPLPHPSWRNNTWLKKNEWFQSELLVQLKKDIRSYF